MRKKQNQLEVIDVVEKKRLRRRTMLGIGAAMVVGAGIFIGLKELGAHHTLGGKPSVEASVSNAKAKVTELEGTLVAHVAGSVDVDVLRKIPYVKIPLLGEVVGCDEEAKKTVALTGDVNVGTDGIKLITQKDGTIVAEVTNINVPKLAMSFDPILSQDASRLVNVCQQNSNPKHSPENVPIVEANMLVKGASKNIASCVVNKMNDPGLVQQIVSKDISDQVAYYRGIPADQVRVEFNFPDITGQEEVMQAARQDVIGFERSMDSGVDIHVATGIRSCGLVAIGGTLAPAHS